MSHDLPENIGEDIDSDADEAIPSGFRKPSQGSPAPSRRTIYNLNIEGGAEVGLLPPGNESNDLNRDDLETRYDIRVRDSGKLTFLNSSDQKKTTPMFNTVGL